MKPAARRAERAARVAKAVAAASVSITAAVVVLVMGCGHAVERRPPFTTSAGIPRPRDLVARVSTAGIDLTWRATLDDRRAVDGWRVERRTTLQTGFAPLAPALLADTAYADREVVDNVRYVYRVVAVTGAGLESLPAETPPVRADLLAPSVPTDVTVEARPGALEVAFRANPEADVAYYVVRVAETGTTHPPRFETAFASPLLVTGLATGGAYEVAVAAVDSAGSQSAFSDPVAGLPAAPAGMGSPTAATGAARARSWALRGAHGPAWIDARDIAF